MREREWRVGKRNQTDDTMEAKNVILINVFLILNLSGNSHLMMVITPEICLCRNAYRGVKSHAPVRFHVWWSGDNNIIIIIITVY